MKKPVLLLLVLFLIVIASCKKTSESANFRNLTSITWKSDTMMADGVIADGPGQMLEKFKGDARFNADGQGYFGQYSGTWRFSNNEKYLVIESDSLAVPLTANIVLLTAENFKITTSYPNPYDPFKPFSIRMTFIPK